MARKVYISILGTGYYLETKYYFGKKPSENEKITRFIQERTIGKFCKEWTENDRIFIFLTKEARKKNWIENAQDEHPDGSYKGLSEILKELNLSAKIVDTNIEDGLSEKEIWIIFEQIYKIFKKDDKVYLDITHAFRYLPMLSMVLINYAKFLQSISVEKITYGAFEKLGPAYKVKNIDINKRYAPILDLTALSFLQDWTNATKQFIVNGRGEELAKQLTNIQSKTYKQNSPFKATTISNFGKIIGQLAQALTVNRIDETSKFSKSLLNNKISVLTDFENIPETKPFSSLIRLITDKFKRIANANEDIFSEAGFEALVDIFKYYISTKQYPNAITIAREAVVSKVCVQMWLEPIEDRHVAEHLLNTWKQRIQTKFELKGFEYQSGIMWLKIVDIRNDINHASMKKNPIPSKSLIEQIQNIEDELSKYLVKTN